MLAHPAGALEDDALLEAVLLLGALAGQPEFDQELAASGLVSSRQQTVVAATAAAPAGMGCLAVQCAAALPPSMHAVVAQHAANGNNTGI